MMTILHEQLAMPRATQATLGYRSSAEQEKVFQAANAPKVIEPFISQKGSSKRPTRQKSLNPLFRIHLEFSDGERYIYH